MTLAEKSLAAAIGQRIKFFRELRRMTQTALAKLLHVSRQAIQKYETGRAMLSVARAQQLCRILKITPNELMGCATSMPFASLEGLLARAMWPAPAKSL